MPKAQAMPFYAQVRMKWGRRGLSSCGDAAGLQRRRARQREGHALSSEAGPKHICVFFCR